MTLEQAIRILHPDTSLDTLNTVLVASNYSPERVLEAENEATILACEVMQREVDRTKTHGKRTITLPCDYNDTLYAINRLDKTSTYIFVCEIDYIAVESSGEIVVHATFVDTKYHKNPYRMVFMVSDFGQTVFTTREKAEKAAQNRSGKPLNDGKVDGDER